jgi:uncharacterized protein involved in exopolysaccharide biosynthesis
MSEQLKPADKYPTDDGGDYRRFEPEDEINLLDLALVVAKNKRMILGVTFAAAFIAAGISLLLPNTYRAEVVMVAAKSGDSKGGGLSAALGGLGGLASLAGVSLGGGGTVEENIAVLKSRDFLWQFVQEKKLMPVLFEDQWDAARKTWKEADPQQHPGQMDVYRLFNTSGLLDVSVDKKTELITVSVEWTDAERAAEWANELVAKLNAYLAQQAIARSENSLKYLNEELARTPIEEMRKTLFDLIATEQKNAMLANTQKDFAFRVLDPALVPDQKSSPKRALIVILAGLVGTFFALIWALLREGLRSAEQSPEQQERLRQLKQALRWKDR